MKKKKWLGKREGRIEILWTITNCIKKKKQTNKSRKKKKKKKKKKTAKYYCHIVVHVTNSPNNTIKLSYAGKVAISLTECSEPTPLPPPQQVQGRALVRSQGAKPPENFTFLILKISQIVWFWMHFKNKIQGIRAI